jgi:cyclophilin family peptidyl-prolyl cis-trans isomerase
VVFGRVVSGLRIIKLVEKLDCVNEKPTTLVKITGAGEYVRGEK